GTLKSKTTWFLEGYNSNSQWVSAPAELIAPYMLTSDSDTIAFPNFMLSGTRLGLYQATASQAMGQAAALQEAAAAAAQKSEVDAAIHREILAEYEKALAAEDSPSDKDVGRTSAKDERRTSAKYVGRIVAPRVKARGYPNVSAKRVQEFAEGEQYKP